MRENDPYTLDSRALIYLKLSNLDAAIADYDRALRHAMSKSLDQTDAPGACSRKRLLDKPCHSAVRTRPMISSRTHLRQAMRRRSRDDDGLRHVRRRR